MTRKQAQKAAKIRLFFGWREAATRRSGPDTIALKITNGHVYEIGLDGTVTVAQGNIEAPFYAAHFNGEF